MRPGARPILLSCMALAMGLSVSCVPRAPQTPAPPAGAPAVPEAQPRLAVAPPENAKPRKVDPLQAWRAAQAVEVLRALKARRKQDEAAKAHGVPTELSLKLGDNVRMDLVFVPPGRFMMGDDRRDASGNTETLRHEVVIRKPFHMGRDHVTWRQFAAFVAASGYRTDSERGGRAWIYGDPPVRGQRQSVVVGCWGWRPGHSWRNPGFDQTASHPVVVVSHNDAVAFCAWLSKKTRRTISLPTEAQWEYACRAGTTTKYWWTGRRGNGRAWFNGKDRAWEAVFKLRAWYGWNDGYVFTSPVREFRPNDFGLFDMHGNAWQWCSDWWDKDYYAKSPKVDPAGPAAGEYRVVRGGSWADGLECRASARYHLAPGQGWDHTGFRVICTLDRRPADQENPASRPVFKPEDLNK